MPIVRLPNNKTVRFPDGMSRQDMESAIHAKFPDLAPKKQEQQQAVGAPPVSRFNIEEAQRLIGGAGTARPGSIAEDIETSVKGIPGAALNLVTSLPGEALGAGTQLVTDPLRFGKNVVGGLGELGEGLLNLTPNTLNYLKSKGLPIPEMPTADFGIQEALGLEEAEPGDALLRGLSGFIPLVGTAGKIGKAANIGRAGQVAGASAIQAVGQNQDPIQAAALGAGLESLSIPKNKISPLSPSELKENVRITEGTGTSLGEVLSNPAMKRLYENVTSKVPFSGGGKKLYETGVEVKTKGQNLVNKLAEKFQGEDTLDTLINAVDESHKKGRTESKANYDKLSEKAKGYEFSIGRQNVADTAKQILGEIRASDELMARIDKGMIKELEALSKPTPTKSIWGESVKISPKPKQSISGTNIYRSELGAESKAAYRNSEPYKGSVYGRLYDAINKDMETAFEKAPEDLKADWRKAQEYYKENVAPYEKGELAKFTLKDGDPDTLIQTFVKTSRKSDRVNLLNRLLDNLPEGKKDLVAFEFFNNAMKDGEFKPETFNTLYRSLGDKQRKALLKDSGLEQEFRDYSKLVSKNDKALKAMTNPMTGQATLDTLGLILGANVPVAGIPGVGASLASRLANSFLTSPTIRKQIVKRLTDEAPKKPTYKALRQGYNAASRSEGDNNE